MPEEMNPIEQRLTLLIEDKIVGDAAAKHLQKVTKAFTRTQNAIKKYETQFQRHAKSVKASLPSLSKYEQSQQRLAKSVNASLAPMRNQLDLIRKSRKEMAAADRVSQKLGRSLTRIAGVIGAGGLLYAAFRRIQDNASKTLNLAVTGGPGQVKMVRQLAEQFKVNQLTALDLTARFQGQSPYNRFALGDSAIKGLIAAQSQMDAIGSDRARDLILAVTQSLEPARAKAFLNQSATGNVRQALLGAANQQNIGAVTSALNALQIDRETGSGKLDPLLQAQLDATKAVESLGQAFDKLATQLVSDLLPVIDKISEAMTGFADFVGGLSTGKLVGLGVGGFAAYKALDWTGSAIARRLIGGGGRGFRMPPAGFGGGGGFRMPGMRPMLPGPTGGPLGFPAMRTIPRPFSWGMPVTGGVLGYGLPAAAAAGSIYTAGRSAQTAYNERQALKAIQTSMQDRGLFDVASRNKSNANTELERLIAKRQEISAMLLSAPMGDVGKRGWLGQKLGFYGDFPESDPKQTEKLRTMYGDIQKRIKELRAIESTGDGSQWTDWILEGLEKAKDAAGRFKTGFDDLVQKGLEQNVKRLQQQAARMQGLELNASEQSALTQLSRLDFDIARTTPFGTVGAFGEWRDLQVQLNREIESLTEVMKNIDQNTRTGRIEAARLNAQIKSLRLEERQRSMEMMRGVLDSVQAQAFGVGKFEKILITDTKNLRIGLDRGIIQARIPGITGSLTPSGRKPVRLNPATNAVDAVKNLGKAATDLVGYLEEIIGEDESDFPMRPGRPGNATLN